MNHYFTEPHLLITFITIFEEKSLNAAAKKLNRSQPAISLRLAQLEEQIGFKLFERTGTHGSFAITPKGRQFLRYAKDVLREYLILGDKIRSIKEDFSDEIIVSTVPTIDTYILPSVYRLLQQRNIPIKLQSTTGNNLEDVLQSLKSGEVDLAITFDEKETKDYHKKFHYQTSAIAICTQTYLDRLSIDKTCFWNNINQLDIIGYIDTNVALYENVNKFLYDHDLLNSIKIRTRHIGTVINHVTNHQGVGFIPNYLITKQQNILDFPLPTNIWTGSLNSFCRHSIKDYPFIKELRNALDTILNDITDATEEKY